MKLFGWFRSETRHPALEHWRQAWQAAVEGDASNGPDLRAQLEALATAEPDVEVELEMLDGLEQLRRAQRLAAEGTLPSVDTQHRVIGGEHCHFTAPASMPTDHAQSSGRVLLTGSRAIFVGAGQTSTIAWHAVHDIARIERDVLLARADRTPAAHFRFNNYGDALVCAFLASRLKPSRSSRL